jgi:hypothetical protein
MIRRAQWLLWAALASAPRAEGKPMDPALGRLALGDACGSGGACTPDQASFVRLMSQWGSALLPAAAHDARSSGLAGFELGLHAGFTSIDARADYWQRGTEGSASTRVAARNTDPDDWLQLYSLGLRKGLGFGIEAAGSIGLMPHTSLVAWGAELSVSLLEGFRRGTLGYLPDLSLGAALREVSGLGLLELSTLALEARLSKPFVIAGQHVLTPWLGYQHGFIMADSGLVDLTPGIDAFVDPGDRVNDASFASADLERQRLLLGTSYRYELAKLSAQLITDVVSPASAQTSEADEAALACSGTQGCRPAPRQWTLVVEVGAAF